MLTYCIWWVTWEWSTICQDLTFTNYITSHISQLNHYQCFILITLYTLIKNYLLIQWTRKKKDGSVSWIDLPVTELQTKLHRVRGNIVIQDWSVYVVNKHWTSNLTSIWWRLMFFVQKRFTLTLTNDIIWCM